ncbi:putative alanyl-tRNA synthetase [Arthrobacter sp. PAMC 25486]|nr:putative alanyl-tRNA synthetase [Arthrobacter sp. PAMC 25486]
MQPLIVALEELTQTTYEQHTAVLRTFADHVRGAVFLAFDGVCPGNKANGYVMRRLLRRAMRFGFGLGVQKNFFSGLVPVVVSLYQDAYPELALQQENIEAVLTKEDRPSAAPWPGACGNCSTSPPGDSWVATHSSPCLAPTDSPPSSAVRRPCPEG